MRKALPVIGLVAATTLLVFGWGPWNGVSRAQAGKKVYISVDMEGLSGVSGGDQTSARGAEYGRTRLLMAADTSAAIRGALAGGATDILVNDSHGGQRNIRLEDLHPSARLISHSFKRVGMMEGLDNTFDAAIFIGYHTKADTFAGLFAHTGSGVVRDLRVNGVSVGEGGLNTLLASWYGVPVVLVTGDDQARGRASGDRGGGSRRGHDGASLPAAPRRRLSRPSAVQEQSVPGDCLGLPVDRPTRTGHRDVRDRRHAACVPADSGVVQVYQSGLSAVPRPMGPGCRRAKGARCAAFFLVGPAASWLC